LRHTVLDLTHYMPLPQLGRGAASHGGFALDNKSEESIDLSASVRLDTLHR